MFVVLKTLSELFTVPFASANWIRDPKMADGVAS
jgi:hypothetical protein